MTPYGNLTQELILAPKVWLVTGAAGFIGSNLIEALLRFDQRVVGLDNYATGWRHNLQQVQELVGLGRWNNFLRIDGDIQDLMTCQQACQGVDYVLHHAALGSVPGSIAEPGAAHASNVTGFLNMVTAARDNAVQRFVYASSSAVYGDQPDLPKVEQNIGRCLSPYAANKRMNELYADVFARCYGLQSVGLRYFNVFGPRQDPEGAYAAVIPKWIAAMIRNQPIHIHGDGETSRDFCYVANVVQANLLAATVKNDQAINEVYNVAVTARTTLNQLFTLLRDSLLPWFPQLESCQPVYQDFRPGDVRHSEGDISKARHFLGYQPTHTIERGMAEALAWYRQQARSLPEVSSPRQPEQLRA